MNPFEEILKGGDVRSIGESDSVVPLITSQGDFDQLFTLLYHSDRMVAMRAADVLEKVTRVRTIFLKKHKKRLIELAETAVYQEIKWHLSLLLSRLELNENEMGKVWQLLTSWALCKKEGRIVRVNAIQSLSILLNQRPDLQQDFDQTIMEAEREQIASINARIRILRSKKGCG